MKKFAKKIIPATLWSKLGSLRRRWISRDDHKRTTREVFSRIYEKRLWSGDGEFSSGTGSRDECVVQPYLEAIKQWAADNKGTELTALDLGCGDFHVGRNLYPIFKSYIAADIVPALIARHRKEYESQMLSFECVDAIEDELPEGDVVFVRQVLQHLSNEQILKILPKLQAYRYAIITEHLPHSSVLTAKNLDKPHGGGIRLSKGSGVFIGFEPFEFPALSSQIILELPASEQPVEDGMIVTTCYRFR